MTLTPQQLSAMTDAGQSAPAQSTNGNPPWLQAMLDAGMDSTQSAATLGHATGMLQKTFQSPMQNIQGGPQQQNPSQSQPFQNGITQQDPTGSQSKALATGALPMAGAIGGGALGALAGGVAASPTILGIPAGIIAGGAVGAGLGSSAGEAAKEKLQGQGLNPGNIAKTGLEFGALEAVGGPAASLIGKVGGLAKPIISALADSTGVTKFLADRADKKALQSTLDAVYNSPTGKKFTQTAGQIIGGKREITPSSIFREQGITPDQQTVDLATRLKDVGLGKDPVKNTQILANEMTNTEAKLQTALKGDPSVQYLADKPKLFQTLDEVKNTAPEEFRIKDSQTMVNKVVDFANKLATKAEDNIGGLRDGRIAFDSQAKREFPSAFKPDGTIDTKTPSGYAIKTIRDSWNEHLYNTAPNGSEIQSLIGRESDLYRANQAAVEKAASGQGKKSIQRWIENNPKKAGAIGAAGGLEINKKLKDWTGIGF